MCMPLPAAHSPKGAVEAVCRRRLTLLRKLLLKLIPHPLQEGKRNLPSIRLVSHDQVCCGHAIMVSTGPSWHARRPNAQKLNA